MLSENAPAEIEPSTVDDRPHDTGKTDRRSMIVKLLTYLAIPVFAACFALYAIFGRHESTISLIAPALSLLFFAAAVLRLIPMIVLKKDRSELIRFGERSRNRLHPWFGIILFSIMAQVVLVLLVYAAYSIKNGVDSLLPEGYAKLFVQARGQVFGENTRSIASSLGLLSFVLPQHVERLTTELWVYIPVLVLNTLAVAASAVLMYELVICDHSKRCAKFSVLLLHILPLILPLMQPFSGTALFFAFCLLSLLLARRRRLFAAGAAALIASLFNIFAVLLIVPIAVEWFIHSNRRDEVDESSSLRTIKPVWAAMGLVLSILPVGIAAVLKALGLSGLSGLDLRFAENADTIGRLMHEWNGEAVSRTVIVISLVALVLLALLILFGARFARASHTAFALVYTLVPVFISTQLALFGVLSLPIFASLIGEKCTDKLARLIIWLVSAALLILFIVFLYIKRIA